MPPAVPDLRHLRVGAPAAARPCSVDTGFEDLSPELLTHLLVTLGVEDVPALGTFGQTCSENAAACRDEYFYELLCKAKQWPNLYLPPPANPRAPSDAQDNIVQRLFPSRPLFEGVRAPTAHKWQNQPWRRTFALGYALNLGPLKPCLQGYRDVTSPTRTLVFAEQADYRAVEDGDRQQTKDELKQYHTVVLPDGLDHVPMGMFDRCKQLCRVLNLVDVRAIYPQAFRGCSRLHTVDLREGLEFLSKECFTGCGALQLEALPDSVKMIGVQAFEGSGIALRKLPASYRPTVIAEMAFKKCANLRLTELPATVRGIGIEAFKSCTRLQLTALPPKLEIINNGAFAGCFVLALTALPATVQYVGTGAFYLCCRLGGLKFPPGAEVDEDWWRPCDSDETLAAKQILAEERARPAA